MPSPDRCPFVPTLIAVLFGLALVGAPVLAGSAPATWDVVEAAEGGCALESARVALNDGYLDIEVQLRFHAGQVRALTPSNLDLDAGDLGLTVDDKQRFAVAELDGPTDLLLAAGADEVGAQFVRGREAVLRLRFWPTWPVTGTKSAAFSLIGFTKAWTQYQECR